MALLRGINVGGKNKLPMEVLSAMFQEAGCTEVRTYIASGNVIFRASTASIKTLSQEISRRIASDFGLRVPVVLRSAEEFRKIVRDNPLSVKSIEPKKFHVGFLAEQPGKTAVAALDPERSPGDRFVLRGREIYMYLGRGAADTKLTNAYFDNALKTVSTFRNWRTVLQLAAMLDSCK